MCYTFRSPNAFPNGKGLPYLSHVELHLSCIHSVIKYPPIPYFITQGKEDFRLINDSNIMTKLKSYGQGDDHQISFK